MADNLVLLVILIHRYAGISYHTTKDKYSPSFVSHVVFPIGGNAVQTYLRVAVKRRNGCALPRVAILDRHDLQGLEDAVGILIGKPLADYGRMRFFLTNTGVLGERRPLDYRAEEFQ